MESELQELRDLVTQLRTENERLRQLVLNPRRTVLVGLEYVVVGHVVFQVPQ